MTEQTIHKSVGSEDYFTARYKPTGDDCLLVIRDDKEMYLYADEDFWLVPHDQYNRYEVPVRPLSVQGCGAIRGS